MLNSRLQVLKNGKVFLPVLIQNLKPQNPMLFQIAKNKRTRSFKTLFLLLFSLLNLYKKLSFKAVHLIFFLSSQKTFTLNKYPFFIEKIIIGIELTPQLYQCIISSGHGKYVLLETKYFLIISYGWKLMETKTIHFNMKFCCKIKDF